MINKEVPPWNDQKSILLEGLNPFYLMWTRTHSGEWQTQQTQHPFPSKRPQGYKEQTPQHNTHQHEA